MHLNGISAMLILHGKQLCLTHCVLMKLISRMAAPAVITCHLLKHTTFSTSICVGRCHEIYCILTLISSNSYRALVHWKSYCGSTLVSSKFYSALPILHLNLGPSYCGYQIISLVCWGFGLLRLGFLPCGIRSSGYVEYLNGRIITNHNISLWCIINYQWNHSC